MITPLTAALTEPLHSELPGYAATTERDRLIVSPLIAPLVLELQYAGASSAANPAADGGD